MRPSRSDLAAVTGEPPVKFAARPGREPLCTLPDPQIVELPPAAGAFQHILRLTASIHQASVALIALEGEEEIESVGEPLTEETRALLRPICLWSQATAIGRLFWVEDARLHPLLTVHPLVAGKFELRFFASAPLLASGGRVLGTLCVLGHQPRALDLAEQENLRSLAGLAAGEVSSALERDAARRAVADERERLTVTLASLTEGVITTDIHGNVELMNRVAEELTGHPAAGALGRPLGDVFSIEEDNKFSTAAGGDTEADSIVRVLATGRASEGSHQVWLWSRDGTRRRIAREHLARVRRTRGDHRHRPRFPGHQRTGKARPRNCSRPANWNPSASSRAASRTISTTSSPPSSATFRWRGCIAPRTPRPSPSSTRPSAPATARGI